MTTDALWRGGEVGFWADFDTRDGAWDTVDIPFSRFVPRYRGTRLEGIDLDLQQVTGMGLMIYDKLDGPFEVHIARVAAYVAPFSLEQYRWKYRVVVVSAPAATDEELAKVQADVAATAADFEDRDLVLVTLLEEGVSTAGSTRITPAHAASLRTALGIRPGHFALRLIGKDGSTKFSRGSEVALSEIYDIIDAMPMRRREMSDE